MRCRASRALKQCGISRRIHCLSLEEAVASVRPGDNCFVHTAMMSPVALLDELVRQRQRFVGNPVKFFHLHTEGRADYLLHPESFHSTAFFCAANDRAAVNSGRASFIPVFLSEVSTLWKTGRINLDVALLSVSPPDKHGMCSLGTSVDVSVSALQHAKRVIAVVNENVPRMQGDGMMNVNRIDSFVKLNTPLPLHQPGEIGEIERKVGENVATLIPNGATLQMGIGSIPDAVLSALKGHKHLGIHSEMFSDGVVDLVESGAIDGSMKSRESFQIVGSFVVGSKRLVDFIDDNPSVKLLRSSYVNDPHVIREHEKMHAINSLVQIDLTGQVCADSIGTRIWSGIGGQMDFVRGASLSRGGKAVMAFTSRTNKGVSRIVPTLDAGAGVTVTRNHIHYVATEYGTADLFGKSLQERAKLLIGLAHPEDRSALQNAFASRFK